MSRNFAENFSPHSAEKFCRGTRLCYRKFRVSKNSMHKRGISQISIENLLSHSTEDFREGILCFWKNPGSEKIFWMKSGVSCFSVESFWSHIAEEFREHPFIVSKKLGYRKILCLIGCIMLFCRKFLVSQCRKIWWASLQCFKKFGATSNFIHQRRRGYQVSPSKTFVTQYRKMSLRNSSVFQKISCIAKIYA